jgi:mannose-6-phosphate isomerase-like protein (cupin superfamily)
VIEMRVLSYITSDRPEDHSIPLLRMDRLSITLKTYEIGGENEFHYHRDEDHAFIILSGTARFTLRSELRGDSDEVVDVSDGQIIALRETDVYKFKNAGPGLLRMLRVGGSGPHTIPVRVEAMACVMHDSSV